MQKKEIVREITIVELTRKVMEAVIFLVVCFIVVMTVTAIMKPSVTEAELTGGPVIYNGVEQAPDFVVKSGDTELAYQEQYRIQGNWIGEDCGTYIAGFCGVGKYDGEKDVKWKIVQGKAEVDSVHYRNGKLEVEGTYPYLNGYVEFIVTDKANEVVAQKVINGYKHKDDPMKVRIKPNKTMNPGKYKLKVKTVSFSEDAAGTVKTVKEEGKATETFDFEIK